MSGDVFGVGLKEGGVMGMTGNGGGGDGYE